MALRSEVLFRFSVGRGLTVALLGGVMDFLVHPGVGLFWFAPLTFVPFLLVAPHWTLRQTLAIAFLTGVVAWTLALYWIPSALTEFSDIALAWSLIVYSIVVVAQAVPYLLAAVGGALGRRWRVSFGVGFAMSLAAVQALLNLPLPYSHAVSLIEFDWGRGFVATFGRDLSSFAVVGSGAMVAWVLMSSRKRRKPFFQKGLLTVSGLSALVVAMRYSDSMSPGEPLRIALVQSDFPVQAKRRDAAGVLKWHESTTVGANLWGDVDLIVWGETALATPRLASEQMARVRRLAEIPILFGAVVVNEECRQCGLLNSAVASHSCVSPCVYDKQHLIPLAESSLGIPELLGGEGNLARFGVGSRSAPLEINRHLFGPLICYEAMFPELARSHADDGAEVLVNLVSDSWLKSGMASRALEGLARLNAVEVGLPLVRLVDGGPSTWWAADGRKRGQTASGTSAVAIAQLTPPAGPSFYQRHRWVTALLGATVLLGQLLMNRAR